MKCILEVKVMSSETCSCGFFFRNSDMGLLSTLIRSVWYILKETLQLIGIWSLSLESMQLVFWTSFVERCLEISNSRVVAL